MTAGENAQAIRTGYEAFAARDMAAVARVLAPDIVWHMAGHSPLAGTYRGLQEVSAYLAELMRLTEGTYAIEVRDVLASERHVVVLVQETGQRGASRLAADEAHVWRMDGGGRAAEFRAYREDGEAVDAFWS